MENWVLIIILAISVQASELSDLAESMKPGWSELQTINDESVLETKGGLWDIFDSYSTQMAYDPSSDAVYYVGCSHHGDFICKFVKYDINSNTWSDETGWPGFPQIAPNPGSVAHGFDHNTVDFKRGDFYFRQYGSKVIQKYDISEGSWSTLPPAPTYPPVTSGFGYFSALDKLVYVNSQHSKLAYYDIVSETWDPEQTEGVPTLGSYADQACDLPAHDIFVIGGGNGIDLLYAIDVNKTITEIGNPGGVPLNLKSDPDGGSIYLPEPVSGDLLLFSDNGHTYTWNPTEGWQDIGIEPKLGIGTAQGHAAVSIPKYSVVMAVRRNNYDVEVWLYKHSESLNVRPGHWYEIPDTKLRDVAYNWSPNPVPTLNGVGFKSVMTGWCGGTFDTTGNRLLVWGGGHAAYGGNEIYSFDFDDLQWHLVSNPTPYNQIVESQSHYLDGHPVSRHTYQHIQYHPGWNALVTIGGWGIYGNGFATKHFDYYDFDTADWVHKGELPWISFSNGAYVATAVDTSNEHIWAMEMQSGNQLLREYDPNTDTWTQRSEYVSPTPHGAMIMVIDPVKKILVLTGRGIYHAWSIASYDGNGYALHLTSSSSGPQDVVTQDVPTLAYDSKRGNMVSWLGGTDVFVLDLDNHTWKRIAAAENNTVIPTLPTANGVYGRWQYVTSEDVFVVVNSVDENVFVYKPADNGTIACTDLDDVVLIIHRWKTGQTGMAELMQEVKDWKDGC